MIKEQKKKLRQELLSRLGTHKEESRRDKNLKITKKLLLLEEFLKAKTILFYLTLDGEVDTFMMIKESIQRGKRVAVPVIRVNERQLIPSHLKDLENDLRRGPYGVFQPKEEYIRPIPLQEIDLVIVPGVAFDHAGNRLGRGMGYFDRFLASLPRDTPTIGLAFDFQVVEDLSPLEPHDYSVSKVLFA